MNRMDWMKLKSGSDVRGTAVGEGTVLTDEVACALGAAFALWLSRRKCKPAESVCVAVGRDSRVSGPDLLKAFSEGVCSAGASVMEFGLCTTPAMFMSTITEGYRPDGAVMVTASHHPWNKNGLKFFTDQGGLEGNDISVLLKEAASLHPDRATVRGTAVEKPFLPVYMEQLAARVREGMGQDSLLPLKGLHVVVDAGNGAG